MTAEELKPVLSKRVEVKIRWAPTCSLATYYGTLEAKGNDYWLTSDKYRGVVFLSQITACSLIKEQVK